LAALPLSPRTIIAVILWMAGALISFSAAALGVRALSQTLGLFDILTLRSATGIIVLLAVATVRPALLADLNAKRLPLHVARNVIHFAATYGWALALTLLPLATVFALEFTMPVWVALLAVLLLGERMTPSRVACVALGFAGALVILKPGLETLQPAALLMLMVAAAFAISVIATKLLTATQSTYAILFWMNLIQLPLNWLGSGPSFWTKVGPEHAWPLAGICLGGLSAHLCLTNAYRHGDATMVVPLDFLRIPLIALIGWRLYDEPLDPFVFLGSALIIAGILWNLRAETRPGPARPA
jgi:drug/metabolite transporter (DMT)-like permease